MPLNKAIANLSLEMPPSLPPSRPTSACTSAASSAAGPEGAPPAPTVSKQPSFDLATTGYEALTAALDGDGDKVLTSIACEWGKADAESKAATLEKLARFAWDAMSS